jgi:antitoxin ParD1/3/4
MPIVKRSYSITHQLDEHVKEQVASGQYASDSEYLRELIRRDQRERQEIEFIRQKLRAAESRGFTTRDRASILAEFRGEQPD